MAAAAVELVIFDCDGVLVDSESLAARNLEAALAALDFPLGPETIAACRGLTLGEAMARLEAAQGRPLPADFATTLRARDVAAFEKDLKPVAGAAEALDGLAGRVGVCVASSGSPEKMRHSLGLTGLLGRVAPHLFSAAQVGRGKPAPDLFLFAAERMGAAPARALVIEDSVHGIAAAGAAGMRAWGFVGASHADAALAAKLAEAGAERVFARLAELPAMLGL